MSWKHPVWNGWTSSTMRGGCKRLLFISIWDLWTYRDMDLCQTSCMEHFYVLKKVPIYFSYSGECCNAVLLLSFSNVLWAMKPHPSFHHDGGEWIMTDFFLFWVSLSFQLIITLLPNCRVFIWLTHRFFFVFFTSLLIPPLCWPQFFG